MTLQVFSRLWQLLYARFGLEPQDPGGPSRILRTVVPVTSADDLLAEADVIAIATFTNSGTANQRFLTVPANERWTVHAYEVYRASGDRNLAAYLVFNRADDVLALIASVGASVYRSGLATPYWLDGGMGLGFSLTGGSTDGDWEQSLLVKRDLRDPSA